jgi:hypothetical protein
VTAKRKFNFLSWGKKKRVDEVEDEDDDDEDVVRTSVPQDRATVTLALRNFPLHSVYIARPTYI